MVLGGGGLSGVVLGGGGLGGVSAFSPGLLSEKHQISL